MSLCIYCAGRRGDESRTDEHIWPQALGGEQCPPATFRTNQVCGRCNSLAGQWVDRAFLRNFFTSSERGTTARAYLDPMKPSPLPLTFMGHDTEIPLQDGDVCERWIGPSGESIYHIHERDDDRWTTLAGGDFFKRRTDPGRVYFYLTDMAPYWFITGIYSILKFFPGVKPRCLTLIDGLDGRLPIQMADQAPLSAVEAHEVQWIKARPSGPHSHSLPIDLGYADRFLAKLALGLGHNILGPAVSSSPYADELRRLLWCNDFSKRGEIAVRGTGPWDQTLFDPVRIFISWPGIWSIFLTQAGSDFAFVLSTPQGRSMSMVISDDHLLWSSTVIEEYRRGVVYFVVPQRQRVFGPASIGSLISHKQGYQRSAILAELEALRTDPLALPPRERATPQDMEG